MIACKDCEFNINGLCQRFPPAFAVTPIGRKWAFPMVGAFEGFPGCGEGKPAEPVFKSETRVENQDPLTDKEVAEMFPATAPEPELVPGLFPKVKPKRSRRKK